MSSEDISSAGESILSLDSAFSPVSDVPIHPANPPTPPPPPPAENPTDEASSAPSSDPLSDSWKEEYDARVASWRAESAQTRTKAEAERARWEELRASGQAPEHELWESVKDTDGAAAELDAVISEGSGTGGAGPAAESVADGINASPITTSLADSRDITSGETSGGQGSQTLANTIGYPSSAASVHTLGETSDASPVHVSGAELSAGEGAKEWEEVPSVASSFPSLPEQHHANSIPLQPTYRRQVPLKREKEKENHHHRHHHKHPSAPPTPPSLTLTVFDSNASARTRVVALVSSLAINMFLPFVNGVMLGFGEIFARNVVGPWFGWPKPVASSVGIRAGGPPKSKRNITDDPFS